MTIRVLHENTWMDPGGIETLLMNVYRNLDRSLVQFDFMIHRPEKAFFEDEINELGGHIYRTARFSPIPGEYRTYMNGVREILQSHPEDRILHAHSELCLWPLKAAKEIGVPIRIAHSHSAQNRVNLKYFFLLYEKAWIKKFCTDMFMCSKLAGEWTFGKKAVNSGSVQMIKNGIDSGRYIYNEEVRKRKRQELRIEQQFVMGHVGRFVQAKNHSFLIDIFAEIHKRRPDSVLLLAGDGPMIEQIKEKAIRLQIGDSVRFLGTRSDIDELLQAMDVFVLPSLWEGLPLTGIEAQAAGLPTFLSDSVTEEVCVTPKAQRVSLQASAADWAERVLQYPLSEPRGHMQQQIIDAGFDIRETAQFLQNYYLERVGSRKGESQK